MQIDDLPERATPKDVAKVLGCSERFMQSECAADNIRCFRIAGRYRIDGPAAVRDYLEEQRVVARPERSAPGTHAPHLYPPEIEEKVAEARRQRTLEIANALKKPKALKRSQRTNDTDCALLAAVRRGISFNAAAISTTAQE